MAQVLSRRDYSPRIGALHCGSAPVRPNHVGHGRRIAPACYGARGRVPGDSPVSRRPVSQVVRGGAAERCAWCSDPFGSWSRPVSARISGRGSRMAFPGVPNGRWCPSARPSRGRGRFCRIRRSGSSVRCGGMPEGGRDDLRGLSSNAQFGGRWREWVVPRIPGMDCCRGPGKAGRGHGGRAVAEPTGEDEEKTAGPPGWSCGLLGEPPEGIEPSTYALRVRRSGRLS